MVVSFPTLSDTARVWIYPSSRKFYEQEVPELSQRIEQFLHNWFSEPVKNGFQIAYQRFLIFGVENDKTIATPDIDKLVGFILELEKIYEIQLLDRMNVCFKQGKYVQYKDLKEFQKLIKQKAVSKNTVVFDNLIENKADFDDYWELPITESWYNRYLK